MSRLLFPDGVGQGGERDVVSVPAEDVEGAILDHEGNVGIFWPPHARFLHFEALPAPEVEDPEVVECSGSDAPASPFEPPQPAKPDHKPIFKENG